MIRNPFRRGEAPSEASEADAQDLHHNVAAERRQKLLFYGLGGALAVGAMAWILQPSTDPTGVADKSGKDGEVKVEIGLARGKKAYDKRQALARRDAQREMSRVVGRAAKGKYAGAGRGR